MKPKDLKPPFTWENQQTVIHDRIWYLPRNTNNGTSFTFPGWKDPLVFGNDNPISIEYCSGNGAWIAGKAQAFPEINWVAVERKHYRVRKIWSKAKNGQIPNLFIVCGEALQATKEHLPAGSIESIYINFPDPWPKNRHAKNRLIQPEFLSEMHRVLRPGGSVIFVTDDIGYSEWTISTFSRYPGFASTLPFPYFTNEMPNYGTSYFEDLWRQKGKTIRYHHYKKQIFKEQ